MCGIVGFNGKTNSVNYLIDGLKSLEYRGYDSAGIAVKNDTRIEVIKAKGNVSALEEKIEKANLNNYNIGIGHTRWATHGVPSEINSHPHQVGSITIVHNGIIENYKELKEMLISKGYSFKSETDTEVACALIDYYYEQYQDIKKSLSMFIKNAIGSYAICVMLNNSNLLYTIKKDCPLIIAKGQNGMYVASDIMAVFKYANKVLYLNDGIIGEVSKENVTLYDENLEKVNSSFKDIPKTSSNSDKNGYEHFMLKEIHEQPSVFKEIMKTYLRNGEIVNLPSFSKYNEFHIVACGSAYHTGLVGKYLIEKYADISVTVEIASEYRYKKNFYNKKTLVIIVSQSGETADSLAALRKAKRDGIDTLAIVNVENSTIAREAKDYILVKAGPEIAVATTKAYFAQTAIFGLIALKIGSKKGIISKKEYNHILTEMKQIPIITEGLINSDQYIKIANEIYKNDDIFYIGRGIDYALSEEGSLKLKEVSYIHSQAYAAGELKHGTISLIENDTPVIAVITEDDLKGKTQSNIEEVKSRGAKTVLITNDENMKADFLVNIPKISDIFEPLLAIIPLQLISYEVAKKKGCNIDKPKNLAKSVTVE